MSEAPWITIIGLGEDGPAGLVPASRAALEAAEIIIGPPRHLALVGETSAQTIPWPVPFADGIETLRGLRGHQVAVLASGDPFWCGAGRAIAAAFEPSEWRSLPAQSVFSLAANRLGWSLETTTIMGLHAAPFTRLRPHLAPGLRAIVTLRDGNAVPALATYLAATGFGDATLTVLEALGGPNERLTETTAHALTGSFTHPVAAAIHVSTGPAVPLATGRADRLFETDGVMTKRPVRALTLSALAPRPGEHLWDIGGGSGTIAIEWLMAHPTCTASTIEPRADRVALIRNNAEALGQDRLKIVQGTAPEALAGLPAPDAVFIGGGLSAPLLSQLTKLPTGTRLVANAVTLETEALLMQAHAEHSGDLLRIDIATSAPLGSKRGWKAAYPLVQWSVTL